MLGHCVGHLGHLSHFFGHLGSLGHDCREKIKHKAVCQAKNQRETTHTHELTRGWNCSVMLCHCVGHLSHFLSHLGQFLGHLGSLGHDCRKKIKPKAVCQAKNQRETTHTHELTRCWNCSVMLGHCVGRLVHLSHFIGHFWSLGHYCSEKIKHKAVCQAKNKRETTHTHELTRG